jgi:tetrahydromethanopterin S-methyltransferase subunit E
MIRTSLVAFIAVVTVSAFAVSSADAAGRRDRQYYGYWYGQSSSASLDGRVTGRARTCGHNTFVYDNRGVPTGPYCH